MRHAIYFVPAPQADLHRLGSLWLGRDATSGVPCINHLDPRLGEITAEARRYGFHGTLKPPFPLKDGASRASLGLAVQRIASQHHVVSAGVLEARIIDGFLALVPQPQSPLLDDLAADCVRLLDEMRKPAGEAELARRRAAGLSPRQEANLLKWGYPYVFEDFRFHMTLSRRLSEAEAAWLLPMASAHFAPVIGRPLIIDAISLVTGPEDGGDFLPEERLPLVTETLKAA